MLPSSIIPSGSPLALYFYSVLILPSFPFQTLVQVALHVGALTPCGIPEKTNQNYRFIKHYDAGEPLFNGFFYS